ncbi:MAG: neuraminidase-like domain-containing protein, partial [Variibacter sp.]
AGRAADLKFTAQLGALTNNNAALVAALRSRQDIRQASDLARLGAADWKSLVATQGVSVPAETPGADAAEKADNYVRTLTARVEAAFPTMFFAERLGASPIATFLKGNPAYDLRTTYPPQFFKALPADRSLSEDDQRQLRSLQRLYRLTGNASEAIALKELGSAQQIARMSSTAFADRYKDALPPARAAEIHAKASRRAALALALFSENGSAFNRTGLRALPTVDTQKQMALAQDSIPDWETLFGSFDFCACPDCASAHGAAAYLVDVLRFLGECGARAALFARRPDLGEIELTCENTNITLPLIDVVNEVLENAVAPPPSFAPFALAPALEADLSGSLASAALSAAFAPPLHPSARIETLEDGKRWRIQDDAFAYGIVKDATGLEVAARSRQTTGTSSERRASPQYRNANAYSELGRAVYPWTLPFDLPSAETRIFLAHLGVSRHDLIDALIPPAAAFDANDPHIVLLAAERLGLTDVERKIVVGEPLTPPRQPADFWGGTAPAALESVQDLLDRSGLSYADLDAALATRFVNPGIAASIRPKSGAPLDTCDTTKLEVAGLAADLLDRLHRFVRLWRKLDWTISELGRVLDAIAGANPPAIDNATLVRIDHLRSMAATLRLPLAVALALWRPIDTVEPGSLYRDLFYNPSVFKPQDDAFRLRADRQELAATDKLLADHAAALQAAFRLDPASLTLLIARTDGKLTLGNLSVLYRHAVLASQLGLTIANLLIATDLTAIDPFGIDHAQDTLRFVEAVKAIQASGFDIPQLDYLLRHRFNPAASFVPTDATLAQTLEGLRGALLAIDAASPSDWQAQARGIVIDRVAAALNLAGDLCGRLLERVMHGGESALQRLSALAETTAPALARDNAAAQFETLEKLLKIATVIQTTKLPASQLDWLLSENPWLTSAPDPASTPVPFDDWFSLIALQEVVRDLSLDAAAVESILGGITAIRAATDDAGRSAGKQAFAEALSRWLGWAQADVTALIGAAADPNDTGILQARLPQDYRIGLVSRLARCIGAVKRLGVPTAVAWQWCEASVSDAVAAAVRGAAKAKYDDAAWQTLAAPLQDGLREQQRAALVAYLVARPQMWGAAAGPADSSDLFAHFLIDVEMSACQLTSRIQQAMASAQLFAQRCLLGLEADVRVDDPKWSQWSWMKTFRVWEASRKIWLYPENWIEPELRDDKTPFFKDLENELMQAELDDDAAEQAFTHYLEKLDQVARLEIAGIYEDDDEILHVFGRTFHAPRTYFYRRRDGGTKVWTPWEKVELDIEGDHIIPVLWNGKLMLIWPIFAEKQQDQQVVMPAPGSKVNAGTRYLEIQLAWSEYQRGSWSGKVVSDPVTFMAYQGDDKVLFGDRVAAPQNAAARIRNDGGVGGDVPTGGGGGGGGGQPGGSLPPPPTSPSGDPKPVVRPELLSFKALVAGDTLAVRGYLRRDYRSAPASGDAQIAYPFGEFRFSGCRKIVTAVPNAQVARRNFALAPSGTKFDRMWFTETASSLILFDGTFPTFPNQILPTVLSSVNEPSSIVGNPALTLVNKLDIPVLDRTPWTYRLMAPHQDLQFVGDRPFFFMDDRRTF